jgi:hypothetical protein
VFSALHLTTSNGTFSATISGDGGGVTMGRGGTLNNCILFGNVASNGKWVGGDPGSGIGDPSKGQGGGVFCSASITTIDQGLFRSVGASFQGAVYNSIVWGNIAGTGSNTFSSGVGNNIYQNTCSDSALSGVGNIGANPIFIDAANGNFQLQSNSPCINWGNNSVVSNTTDLAGNPRIVEGVVDMGAYEYQGIIGLADSDADGISDDWERQHGGNQNPDTVCSNGVNTILQAYVAGLDPKNPNSKFATAILPGSVLQWPGVSGRVYSVYYSTNLLNGFQPLATNIPWTAGAFTDTVHNAQSQGYYKIDVELK